MEVQIISGFLGAGKTTFLNKYLPLLQGRTVVIENEFGEAGIDGDSITTDVPVKEIYAGCICCSLAMDFRKGIKEIADKFQPDRIVIEPSGVGRLSDIVKACRLAREKEAVEIRITKLITVVDIAAFDDYIEGFGAFYRDQIEQAGLLLLSNLEEVPDSEYGKISARIKNVNPGAVLYEGDWRKLKKGEFMEFVRITPDFEEKGGAVPAVKLPADKVFTSISFKALTDRTEEELKWILGELSKKAMYGYILRAKGTVETPQKRKLHFDYTPYASKYKETDNFNEKTAVIIGCNLNETALKQLFNKNI